MNGGVPGAAGRWAIARSLRAKLMFVVLITTACALAFASIALALYEAGTYDTALVNDLETQAEILGRASEAALAFDDPRVATENLAALRLRPQVQAAALYDENGTLFATYPESGASVPTQPERGGHRVEGDRLVLFHPVIAKGRQVGTLYLATRYALTERIVDVLAILAAVMLVSLMIALLLSAWLQGVVTRPILGVTKVAKEVIERRDFSLRATKQSQDETGVLVDAFNDMLGEVGRRAEALEAAYETLQHEIAERRAAEAALRDADRRKDEFLATLAHELRNPLAPLRNGLDILELESLAPERIAFVRALMGRQVAQLTRLVDDLLDVSRISTGKLVLRRERMPLQPAVRNAVEIARPLIEAREHRLEVRMPDEPVIVDGDATRICQLVGNLLNNAAKYTPPKGTIAIDVVLRPPVAEIAVTDTGIGIPPEMKQRVFEMFTQVDTSLDRATAGLGVGLSLAKRLTELHGGTIRAESEGAGRGSRFVVRLPLAEAKPESAAQSVAAAPAAKGDGARHRILLADDNVDFAASLAMILRGLGHEVVVTHDGVEALAAARRFHPEIAFLDIGLPKLHGYALARELRHDVATRAALLVAITGWGQERDRRQAREAGFNHHFVKPVNVDQLVALLASVES